eukprot:c17039_g1_i1.p1 GENE.c17039_g1_i1~~c17039_g1_i1.p1  ORF type:complete len:201 (+),score=28.41 c17039_g1_i1:42-644(+)
MIAATLRDPANFNFYIDTGWLHKFMELQAIHTSQVWELYLRSLVPALGFSTDKAASHVLTTNNNTHLKFPVTNIADYTMMDLCFRIFLEDETVPTTSRSGPDTPEIFLIWAFGRKRWLDIVEPADSSSDSTSSSWDDGLLSRKELFWYTVIYNALFIGGMTRSCKAAIRKGDWNLQQLVLKFLLGHVCRSWIAGQSAGFG